MKIIDVETPFVKEEKRLAALFAAEVSEFGLKVSNGISGHYVGDDVDVYELFVHTEPYPLAGNKELVEALRKAGYYVEVYSPYDWGKRRAFMVSKSFRINLAELKKEVLK